MGGGDLYVRIAFAAVMSSVRLELLAFVTLSDTPICFRFCGLPAPILSLTLDLVLYYARTAEILGESGANE